jgi:hypothetical protein
LTSFDENKKIKFFFVSAQVTFDDEISPQNNELLKFTMCLLPSNIEPKDLIASLPHDVEALVLLSTENRKNLSGERFVQCHCFCR